MKFENAFREDIESPSGIILDECITPLADGDYISACGIRHFETANRRLLHGLLFLLPDHTTLFDHPTSPSPQLL
jgi:hypothetical protein